MIVVATSNKEKRKKLGEEDNLTKKVFELLNVTYRSPVFVTLMV